MSNEGAASRAPLATAIEDADPTPTEVHVLDLGFQGLSHAIAAFLLIGPRGPVLVETGPASTVDALAEGLARHGVAPEDLHAALVTHIHLDHAGAAGWLAARGVTIYVHPRGARHLVDPSRLLASAGQIYGERLIPLWGQTLAVPVEQVIPVPAGASAWAGGLRFEAIETPGHARHHHAWRVGGTIFAGDVAGVRMPGSALVAVPAVPPEFDPPAWRESIASLAAAAPERLALTHFGMVDDPQDHLRHLEAELSAVVDFVRTAQAEGASRPALIDAYVAWSRARVRSSGASEAELARFEAANPFAMSVDGVLGWLKRERRDLAADATPT
jgi:glyoxylase-like metal-dependent hydrolase (beta-lactamase superfamily II)